jgi:hypothetical protein
MTLRSVSVLLHSPVRGQLAWQRELLHLSALFMEMAWCIPLVVAFMPGARNMATPYLMLFVGTNMLAAMELVRIMNRRLIPYNVSRWIVLGALGIACVVVLVVMLPDTRFGIDNSALIFGNSPQAKPFVSPPLVVIAVVIFLWYRGLSTATALITPVRASFSFRLGILIMIVLSVIPATRLQDDLVSLLPLFFFAGLMTTTLARTASLKVNSDLRRSSFGARWVGFSGILGLIVSAVGFLLALFLAGFGVEGASQILRGIFSALALIFTTILAPVLYVLEWLLRPFALALNEALQLLNRIQPPQDLNQTNDLQRSAQAMQQMQMILDVLKYVCLGAIALAVVAVIFAVLRNRAMGEGRTAEEHERLESDSLLGSLGGALRRRLGELGKMVDQFGLSRALIQAITIRRLYARLVAAATELGYPRDPARTPFEYQERLNTAFPGFKTESALVTRTYVNAHYGELPDSPETLTAMQNAVERMIASVGTDKNKRATQSR